MRLVIVESPFRAETEADFERNTVYRQLCIRDSLFRGESPFASHQMYTIALDDNDPGSRDLGIRAGYAWWRAATLIAFYVDLGWSDGMRKAHARARTQNIKIEVRKVNADR